MDIRRRFLNKKKSGGSSGGDSSGTYTVNLNSQWEKTTVVPNPDSSLYDGVYRSSSNYNVNSGVATMYITLTGCSTFKLYIRSYAESNYDYVMVSQLDKTIAGSSSYSNTTLVKAHTRGNQQSGTALSNYTLVEYTGISSGSHTITIVYRKDGSVNNGDDRGYVLIPKSQEGGGDSEGGDVDIDTTYSIMYTSSDGNVVTPDSTSAFGATITSNTYVNGQGIITFDGPATSIGNFAFSGCTSLTSVTIPDSVTSIGYSAFNTTSLTSVTIPDSVTSIGNYAFGSCSSLTSVTIGNGITEINSGAFQKCTSLNAFYGKFASSDNRCLIINGVLNSFAPAGLTEYTIPTSVTSIGHMAFYYCTLLTSVNIPNSVTLIKGSAFANCLSLTSVIIPNSVGMIEEGAFSQCNSLPVIDYVRYADTCLVRTTNLTKNTYPIKESTKFILINAFSSCNTVTSITIPREVINIGAQAFYDCSALSTVYCQPVSPPTAYKASYTYWNAFKNTASNLTIYVPTASVDAYKSASGWKDYADYIVGYNF